MQPSNWKTERCANARERETHKAVRRAEKRNRERIAALKHLVDLGVDDSPLAGLRYKAGVLRHGFRQRMLVPLWMALASSNRVKQRRDIFLGNGMFHLLCRLGIFKRKL